jgi:hypothetical protein
VANDGNWHKAPIAQKALTVRFLSSADLRWSFFVDPFYARLTQPPFYCERLQRAITGQSAPIYGELNISCDPKDTQPPEYKE